MRADEADSGGAYRHPHPTIVGSDADLNIVAIVVVNLGSLADAAHRVCPVLVVVLVGACL